MRQAAWIVVGAIVTAGLGYASWWVYLEVQQQIRGTLISGFGIFAGRHGRLRPAVRGPHRLQASRTPAAQTRNIPGRRRRVRGRVTIERTPRRAREVAEGRVSMNKIAIKTLDELEDRQPAYALVGEVDLCVVLYDDNVSVFYGRCLHRGALMADGYVDGENLICGVHYWDYRLDTGVSEYNNEEILPKFTSWIEDGQVLVDADEIGAWEEEHPQPFKRDEYLGLYADTHPAPEEPHVGLIQGYAKDGLAKTGHHGVVVAMGVPRQDLPELGRHPVHHGAASPHAAPGRRAGRHRGGDRGRTPKNRSASRFRSWSRT